MTTAPLIEVRLARGDLLLAEARRLVDRYIRMWYFDEEPLDEADARVLETFTTVYGPTSAHTAWVALQEGRPVGVLLLRDEGQVRKMLRLYVHPDARRTGAGRALVAAVVRHCDVDGVHLRAMVPEKRTEACALLAQHGLAETGVTLNGFVEMFRACRRPLDGRPGPRDLEVFFDEVARFLRRHAEGRDPLRFNPSVDDDDDFGLPPGENGAVA